MKAPILFFLMSGCAAFMPGTVVAEWSSQEQQLSSANTANTVSGHSQDAERPTPANSRKFQKDVKPLDQGREHHYVSDKSHPRSPATTTRVRPKQPPNKRERFSSGIAMHVHQARSDKSSGTAKSGLIQRDTVNSSLLDRRAKVIRPSAPSLNNVRHRGANPAVIGGSANSARRNGGAISGTSVHRRP